MESVSVELRILEIFDPAGRIRQRLRMAPGDVLRIGRGLDCEVVVDDPYVCPEHARVTLSSDGELQVEDLGSINGIFPGRSRRRVSKCAMKPGQSLRIGHGKLRLTDPALPLPPTRRDSMQHPALAWLRRPWAVAGLVLTMLALQSLYQFLDGIEPLDWMELIPEQLLTLVFLGVWGGGWALANRLISHQFNFFAHCVVGALGYTFIMLSDWGVGVFVFALDVDVWHNWLKIASVWGIVALALIVHLRLVSRAAGRRLVAASVTLAAVGAGISVFSDLALQDQTSAQPRYEFTYKAPVYQLRPGRSPETLLESMDAMVARLEEARQEEVELPADEL